MTRQFHFHEVFRRLIQERSRQLGGQAELARVLECTQQQVSYMVAGARRKQGSRVMEPAYVSPVYLDRLVLLDGGPQILTSAIAGIAAVVWVESMLEASAGLSDESPGPDDV